MSKNLTRKVIAFGAFVALGSSLIAGLPASAATPLASAVTTTYKGTGLSIVEGTDFHVATTIASDYAYYNSVTEGYTATPTEQYSVCILWGEPGDIGDQSDYCVDSEVQTLTAAEAANTLHQDNNFTDAGILNQITTRWASTAGQLKWTKSSDSASVSDVSDTVARFSIAPIAADTAVTFTPYIDLNSNSTKDSNEPSGAATVVTFLNNTGTVLTSTLTGTVDGPLTQDLKNTVTAATGVNLTQMEDDLEVVLYKSSLPVDQVTGGSLNSQALGDGDISSADDSGLNSFNNTTTGYYTTRVMDQTNGSTAFSAASSQNIVGQVLPDSKLIDIEFVDVVNANQTTDREVRSGTKSYDVSAQIFTEDGSDDYDDNDNYAKAGVTVKFTAALYQDQHVDSVIKINGTTITSAGVSVSVPTDANGVAKVTITSTTGADGDDITISATALNSSGNITAYCVDEWSWDDAYADDIWETHAVGYSEFVLGTTQNSNVTLNYEVTDQFAQPFVEAGYEFQIRVVEYSGAIHNIDVTAPLVNGKASVTFNNQEVTGTSYEVEGNLEYRKIGTTSWSSDDCEHTYIVVNHINTVGSLSAAVDFEDNSGKKITYGDFITWNTNTGNWDNTLAVDPENAEGWENYLEGTVVDSNNVPLAGVAVTVSAAGVQLTDDSVYAVGSLTVYTDEFGYYSVEFFTHKAGVNTFTVTSGGKSATATATFANPTVLHAADVLTVTAPVAVKSGTVTPVAVKLVDKYGNGINGAGVKLGVTGAGYLTDVSNLNGGWVELVNGESKATLINGVNDDATATITAATDHEGDYLVASVNPWNLVNKTFSQTVTTGSVGTANATAAKGRVAINVMNSRNETVRVYVAGKRVAIKLANSNNFKFNISGLKKGKNRITVTSDSQTLVATYIVVK